MATPTNPAAIKLKQPPRPQTTPPKTPRRWSFAEAFQNPENVTGSPSKGCRIRYGFAKKQHTKAPMLKQTATLYGVSTCPAVIERVTKGANPPIKSPDTMFTTIPFCVTLLVPSLL